MERFNHLKLEQVPSESLVKLWHGNASVEGMIIIFTSVTYGNRLPAAVHKILTLE